MDGLSYYRDGQLQLAITALGDELKKQPLDLKRRTFLFELLCFAGEYDRSSGKAAATRCCCGPAAVSRPRG